MKIKNLDFKNFRNLKHINIKPCDGVNVIYGDNAQGKTNLIEGIWVFTGAKSFRGSKEMDLIRFDQQLADISLNFYAQNRDQSSRILFGNTKKIFLNDIEKSSPRGLVGSFYCSVFSPVHLSLVKDGPEKRRKFLDAAIAQVVPRYVAEISAYTKIIRQRNSLLKDLRFNATLEPMLDTWDETAAKHGAYILNARIKYVKALEKKCKEIYQGISDGNETMNIYYASTAERVVNQENQKEIEKNLLEALKKSRKNDIIGCTSSVGPHRDDLQIDIDDHSARLFGSQGQQRSCVLALKLAECDIIKDITGNEPVILLDDVMSELDNFRKEYVLNRIKGKQVFITCCDKSYFESIKSGRSFLMKDGEIIKTQEF